MSEGLAVRPEAPGDVAAIRRVHLEAFAPSTGEADLVDALRASDAYERDLCLVAEVDGDVVGHIAFSGAHVDDEAPVLALAPVAVRPSVQGRGVGSALIREALSRAAASPHGLVVVLGHPGYYPRFGFGPAAELGIVAPFEVPAEAWMALRLPAHRPELRGVVRYADAFAAVT